MTDWDGPDLTPLVSSIDHAASRWLFDRRRRRRRHDRWVLCGGIGVGLVVLAGLAGRMILVEDDAQPVATGPGSTQSSVTVATGVATVTVDLLDPPAFQEGFDFAVRFRTPEGRTLEERRLEQFDATADGQLFRTDVTLPARRLRVDAHLTVGIGPGPASPDYSEDAGACPPMAMTLTAGQSARLELDWETGCLRRADLSVPDHSGLLPARPSDAAGVLIRSSRASYRFQLRWLGGNDVGNNYASAFLDTLDSAVLVDGADGSLLDEAALREGQRVEIWFAGCRESAPGQCDVEALQTLP